MTNAQFIFALIGGIAAFLGAAWIVAQAITKTASNPVYDIRFENVAEKMDAMNKSIDCLFERMNETPAKVIEMLRNAGVIRGGRSA